MTEREFWASTPRFFAAKVKAWDARMRYEFERTRTATFLSCSPYLKKHATLNRFWPSPWEKVREIEWRMPDPEILANFERNANDVFEQMKKEREWRQSAN